MVHCYLVAKPCPTLLRPHWLSIGFSGQEHWSRLSFPSPVPHGAHNLEEKADEWIDTCDSAWWVTGEQQGWVCLAHVGGVYRHFPRQGFSRYVLKAKKVLSVKERLDRAFQRLRDSLGKREKDSLQGMTYSEQCISPWGDVKLSKHMFSILSFSSSTNEKANRRGELSEKGNK